MKRDRLGLGPLVLQLVEHFNEMSRELHEEGYKFEIKVVEVDGYQKLVVVKFEEAMQ